MMKLLFRSARFVVDLNNILNIVLSIFTFKVVSRTRL